MRTEKQIKKLWDNNKPTISIICNTYNHEKYISKCLDSILSQKTTYPFEIIVRDDCSTDSTRKIIDQYSKNFKEIIKPIFNEKNYFRSSEPSKVSTVALAKGALFASCEGDDYWVSEKKLEIQAAFLTENTDYACCFHDYLIFDQNTGEHLKGYDECNNKIKNNCDYEIPEGMLSRRDLIIRIPTRMITRDALIFLFKAKAKYTNRTIKIPGDNFYTAIIPKFGKVMYFGTLKAAVFRRHSESSWNPTTMAYKNEMRTHLAIALTKFFSDQKDYEMANYWHQQAISRLDMCLTEIKSSIGNL